MNAVDTDLDVLEEIFTEDIKCQSGHLHVPICTIEVKYRVAMSCGKFLLLVCAECVENEINGVWVRMEQRTCRGCQRHAKDCWQVSPL